MGNSSSRSVEPARGGLVDVSNHVKTVGFVFPVALTREVWLTLVNIRYDHSLIERNPRAPVFRASSSLDFTPAAMWSGIAR